MRLPFIDPDEDIYLNLSIVMIILYYLGTTNRGALKINNDRLHIYDYLVRNPQKLNKFLVQLGKGNLANRKSDYCISSISYNLDPLFDRERMKSILTILTSNKLVSITYKNKCGFLYSLTEVGVSKVEELECSYFTEIKSLSKELSSTLSLSDSQLNININKIITIGNL